MSITALADDEILRTDRGAIDLAPVITPQRLDQVVASLHLPAGVALPANALPDLREALKPVAAASPIQKTPGSNALDGLVKYIPTESITLYVAATAAMSSFTATFPFLTPYWLYWGFVVLTPILFLLIYIGKRRSQNLSALPQQVTNWPWWKFIASTIAFMVWALASPPLVTVH